MSNAFEIPKGKFLGHEKQSVWSEQPDAELTEGGPEILTVA